MTPDEARAILAAHSSTLLVAACRALCAGAGLTVLAVDEIGKQICVTVSPPKITWETVIKRLKTPVTISFGDGAGNVRLYFSADL